MKIKEIKSEKLYKEYNLQIPFEEIDKEIENKINDLIPSVTLPGFRKGKAPVNIVRKKYEDNVINDVIQKVINLKTSDLIKEKKLNIFRQPKIDLKKFEKNNPLDIEIKIDLQPDIKNFDFKKIKINKYEINLSKKDLEIQFNKFIDSQKNFKKINTSRNIKKTDKVILNLETNNLGIPENLRNQKSLPIDTDSDQEILPGLSEQLIKNKLKEGDKRKLIFDLSNSLNNKDLKKVEFIIEVVAIEEKVKFEITDDYLAKNGFKNINELKELLKNNSTSFYNQGIQQIQKKQLMDLLDKEYNFDLPYGLLEDDFKEIWSRIEHAKKNNTLDADDKILKDDALKKRYKKISIRRVKLGVLLQFIAREEKVSISEDELSKGIMQYASQYPGQEKQVIEYIKKNPSSLESIRGPILEQKIIDIIFSKASITNKKINEDQYKKLEEETFEIKKEKI